MSLAELVRRMSEAGAPPEAIAIAIEGIEEVQSEIEAARAAEEAKVAATRQYERERKAKWRVSRGHDGDMTGTVPGQPLDKKERVPPTPPLQEKNSTLFSEANASLVDEPVDARPPSKKLERVESDEMLLDQVTDVWNAFARSHNCPQVKFLTKARGQRCRARLKDLANGEEPIATFRKVLSKCETSFFIRGSPRSPLKFDQLLRENFLVEMLEGDYEFREQKWRR
jgi:hypothetical protein